MNRFDKIRYWVICIQYHLFNFRCSRINRRIYDICTGITSVFDKVMRGGALSDGMRHTIGKYQQEKEKNEERIAELQREETERIEAYELEKARAHYRKIQAQQEHKPGLGVSARIFRK